MKKTLVLALCLIMALCATAFAATTVDGTNVYSLEQLNALDVMVKYTVDDTAVFNIDLAYGTFATTYTAQWNGDKHVYDLNAALEIADGEDSITVTNHANRDIVAAVAWADVADDVTITTSWSKVVANATTGDTNDSTTLESADKTAYGVFANAATVTYTLSFDAVSIDPAGYTKDDATVHSDPRTWENTAYKIGTITLTLTNAEA